MRATVIIDRRDFVSVGSLHSNIDDRRIIFERGNKYAVVLASYFAGCYGALSMHRSFAAAKKALDKCGMSGRIVNNCGQVYDDFLSIFDEREGIALKS